MVAPLVGAWIEIPGRKDPRKQIMSLPLWERGLKFRVIQRIGIPVYVAPLVGAWIEIASAIDF